MSDSLINTANFDQARNALELNGLNAIRQQSKGADGEGKQAALQEAAQQFEAIFMQMLLKSMRKAQEVLESDSPFNSQSTKFYRDMHDQQLGLELSSNGTLGLSELIVRQLGGDDNFTPSTVLRNDGNIEQVKNASKQAYLKSVSPPLAADLNDTANPSVFTPSTFVSADIHEKDTNVPLVMNTVNNNSNNVNNKNKQSVNFTTPTFAEPKDFVSALTEPAKAIQERLGVPFQVIIAQAALETGWGQKIIKDQQGSSSNNLFNIKANKQWTGEQIQKDTLEFEQGAMVKKSAPFRSYQSLSESFKDYADFLIGNDRYQDALENPSNVEHFLQGLQKAGYATDPNYANKIMATLRTVTNLISN
ncbi:flagellar assembly peptidoglycan hydrolase FlgJ [Colwellia sp. KU-HH00111]|uniref:flagellar assembly peptidoglycan hydrolase FlgJ n=1 Tax=Colwellia sp. KU-HH00111 TaxID=3127652 RepID=UPI00310A350F